MATDFTYGGKTITTSGGIRPSTTNTPSDVRTRVNVYSDIPSIPNPWIGQPILVLADETNGNKMTEYRVKSLKANGLGVPNSVIDQVVTLKDFLEITSGSGGSGDGHTHANKSIIDGITQEKVNQWDSKATGNHNHDSVYAKLSEYNTLKSTVETQGQTISNQATTITQLTNLLNSAIARIEALENSQPQPQEVPICGDSTICSNELLCGGTTKAFSQEPIIEVKSALSDEFLKKYTK